MYNENIFDRTNIRDSLLGEGYKDTFIFLDIDNQNWIFDIEVCDEVWTFGYCEDSVFYKKGKEIGSDFWIMA